MKLLVVIAVCVMSTMAMPRENLLSALRRVLDDEESASTSPQPSEIDEAEGGIEGVRMLDWTVMDMLEEGCIRRHSRRPPPPTEAPETTPERKLLNALKRMIGDGSMEPHPRVNKMMKALDQFCGALMARLHSGEEEGDEAGEEDVTTIEPAT